MEAINLNISDEVADDEGGERLDASAAAETGRKTSRSKRGPQFTAMEELMVCKAFIKASKDSIHGSKQKIALFQAQLLIAYNGIKKDQEEDDARDAAKPSHLKPAGCSVATVAYPERTGSSIHQLFTKKISPSVIKYMAVVKQVCLFCMSVKLLPDFLLTATACHKRIKVKVEKMNQHGMHALYRSIKRSMAKNSASSPAISSSTTSPSSYHWSPKEVAVVRMILKKL